MFEKEMEEYEHIRQEYQQKVADRMRKEQWMEYNEILFSAHSCTIEGNTFTVDDTRILREQGMAMMPVGRSLVTEHTMSYRASGAIAGEYTTEDMAVGDTVFVKAELSQKRKNSLPMMFF